MWKVIEDKCWKLVVTRGVQKFFNGPKPFRFTRSLSCFLNFIFRGHHLHNTQTPAYTHTPEIRSNTHNGCEKEQRIKRERQHIGAIISAEGNYCAYYEKNSVCMCIAVFRLAMDQGYMYCMNPPVDGCVAWDRFECELVRNCWQNQVNKFTLVDFT